jgi:hypothetical protein
MYRNIRAVLAGVMILASVGCASTTPPRSGFLKNYGGLVKEAGDEGVWLYRNPKVTYASYDKVMIDPIVAGLDPDRGRVLIDPKALHDLTTYMHDSVKKTVSERYSVVESPGKGVLRLRVALTHLEPSSGAASAQATSGYLSGIGFGSASFEGETRDSMSGERIHAFIAVNQRGIPDDQAGSDQWSQAIAAMDDFGRRFRDELDRAHGED